MIRAYAILQFLPTSELFAVYTEVDAVTLFDTGMMSAWEMTRINISWMSFSPNGRFLAASSVHGISVLDIRAGMSVVVLLLGFSGCLFSPCDKHLAYSVKRTIKFWRPDERCGRPDSEGHSGSIWSNVFLLNS